MKQHFLSTLTPPPAGFEAVPLTKRLLLEGQVAIYTEDTDALLALLDGFAGRVHGFLLTPGAEFKQEQIGPLLWRMWVPERLLPDLRALAKGGLALLEPAIAARHERDLLDTQAQRARFDLETTRRDYHRVTEALHDRVRALTDTQQARAEAEAARRMAELKAAFIDSVSHELRTPLTSIRGYAEFLEDEIGGTLSENQAEFVEQIQQGARRLQSLVDDLLDSARMDAGSFRLVIKPADLAAQARAVVDSLRPQMEEAGLRCELAVPDGGLTAHFDARRIEQVLFNLVSNAIKFTTSGGLVRVEVRQDGDRLHCAVSDTGIGIAAEDVPRLFQRFSQLAGGVRKEGGTGLGLSIAKALVEAHGGQIGVTSTQGQGSTFWFTLPVGVTEEAERASSAQAQA